MSQSLTLPFPPSINHYWKHRGRTAGVYLSKEALAYREAVKHSIVATKPLETRLSVSVKLHAPNRRKYDIDNRVKSLLDALTHSGAWLDDELIDHIQITRGNIIKGGACIVEIAEFKPDFIEDIGLTFIDIELLDFDIELLPLKLDIEPMDLFNI